MADRSPRTRIPSARSPWRRASSVAALLVALLLMAGGVVAPTRADAQGETSPLDQVIDGGQPVATGPAVLDRGHVDIGVHLEGESFTLLVHDDAEVPSVWRRVDDVVVRVHDGALQPVPDDPSYDFLDAEPGSEVHVVPQVEQPGVVWVGWNTQDPQVREVVDRGVTLSLVGVDGPGQVSVFLQSGALGGPQVLWDSTEAGAQPFWAEVDTHTHANWVFTEPGVYLVQVEASADLVDGTTVADTRTLRFAVGDGTSVEAARAAGPLPVPTDVEQAATSPGPADGSGGSGAAVVVGVVGTAVVGVAVAVLAVRRARVRRRAADLARSVTS